MKKIFYLLKISPKLIIIKQFKCVVLILASSISSLCFPYFIGEIIDQCAQEVSKINQIIPYIAALTLSGLLMAIFQYLQSVSIYKLQQEFSVSLKENIFSKCIEGNWKFWNNWKSGDILRILGEDIAQLENTIEILFGRFLVHIFLIIGIGLILIYYDIWIGLVSIVLCIILSFLQKKIGKEIELRAVNLRKDVEENSSYKNETLNNMLSFTMSGFNNIIRKKFNAQTVDLSRKAKFIVRLMSLSRFIGMIYNVIVISTALIIGINRIKQGEMTVGQLYTITIFVQRLYAPIIGLSDAYISMNKSKPIVNKLSKLFNDNDVVEVGKIIPEMNINHINFTNVSFAYSGEKELLMDIDIEVGVGQTLGILGENGIGKSTIVRLLTKKCRCTAGCINLNDVNIDDVNTEYLRNQISVLDQEGNLLSGTIRDIINPFHQSITDEQILDVLKNMAFDIRKLPDGLETFINPNMTNLSGGEKQKLNLARIIIENRQVVILDEPTSALDLDSEELVCEYLRQFLSDKVAIIITHRKSILKICTSVVSL